MSDNTFKFYLKNVENKYLYVSNGSVLSSIEKKELFESVSDWKDATLSFKRSLVYWATFREYSAPQKYLKDAARILRSIFYSEGFTGKCIFYVEKLDGFFRTYGSWFEGDIDLSMANDEENSFTANIKERGLVGLLKARENTPQEIPLNDPDAIQMSVGGVLIRGKATWLFGDTNTALDSPLLWHQDTEVSQEYLPVAYNMGLNQIASFIKQGDQVLGGSGSLLLNFTPASNYNTSKSYLFSSLYDLKQVVVGGNFRVGIAGDDEVPGSYTIRVKLWFGRPNAEGASSFTQFTLGTATFTAPGFVDIPLNATFDMPKDRVAFVTFNIISAPGGVTNTDELFLAQNGPNGSTITVSYSSKVQDTNCKGFRYIDLFKKLVSKMTDGQYTGVSTFLSNTSVSAATRKANMDNSPYNTIATCGDALRGFVGAKIKTSITDFYKDGYSRYALALSVEDNVIRLEPLSFYFTDEVILHLNYVNKVSVKIWTEKAFNQTKAGYGNYDNDNIVGKNEFNTGITFLAKDNDVTPTEEDISSPYRADIYGIESVRAETYKEDDKDNRSDNDVFLIEVDPTPVAGKYIPYRPVGSIITGVDDPQGVYNVTLSPKRELARHLPRIRSIMPSGILSFQTTDKNPELVSNLGSGTISETANIDLSLTTFNGVPVIPLFKPYIIEFECAPPYNFSEILSLQSKGCLSFDYLGTTFKMFILEVGCKPATNEKYIFKGISHPSNDLSKLIR